MTLPSSVTIALPPTFQTSFWPAGPTHLHAGSASHGAGSGAGGNTLAQPGLASPSSTSTSSSSTSSQQVHPPSYTTYRGPLTRLYSHLQAGIDFNARLIALVQHRAASEYAYAESLATPTPAPNFASPIFSGAGQGARHCTTFGALQASVPGFAGVAGILNLAEQEAQRAEAETHGRVAGLLEATILEPFARWTTDHRQRTKDSWEYVEEWLANVEVMGEEVDKLRAAYENKCRAADEAEDDARFAPIDPTSASPPASSTKTFLPSSPSDTHKQAAEKADVSIEKSHEEEENGTQEPEDPEKLKRRETIREQFGFSRARKASGASAVGDTNEQHAGDESTTSIASSGGTSLKRAGTLSSVLSRIDHAARTASSSPIVNNLRAAVSSMAEPKHIRLRKESQLAEDRYRTAVERLDRLRAELEEVIMDHLGLTQKWETERTKAVKAAISQYARAFEPLFRAGVAGAASAKRIGQLPGAYSSTHDMSTFIRALATSSYKPLPQVFHPYYHHDLSTLAGAGNQGFGMNLVIWDRARALAVDDDAKSEASTTHADLLPAPPKALTLLLEALDEAYANDKRWPVRKLSAPPKPAEAEAKEGEAGESASTSAALQDKTPTLEQKELPGAADEQAQRNAEKRRAWIYEVPLKAVHQLRFALIGALRAERPEAEIKAQLLACADPPVLAALVKTWAMELEETLVLQSCWDMVWSLYRAASAQEEDALKKKSTPAEAEVKGEESTDKGKAPEGAAPPAPPAKPTLSEEEEQKIEKGVIEDLKVVLQKLPKIHLSCLNAIIKHLSLLLKSTDQAGSDPLWTQKLGFSTGRVLLRPPTELPQTINARHPHLMAMDFVTHYEQLFPDVVAAKTKEAAAARARPTPVRKRTKPVDMRVSRSSIAAAGKEPPVPFHSEGAGEISNVKLPSLTTNVDKTSHAEDTSPTPIAERMLSGPPETKKAADDKLDVPAASSPEAAEKAGSPAGSAYGTPPDEESPLAKAAASEETKKSDDAPSASASVSNVARLSRQFGGSNGSPGSGAPRGPRPAGARAGQQK